MTFSISEILDDWGKTPTSQLLRDVSDSDVLILAAQAVILLGMRAQACEREDVEQACLTFMTFLKRERAGTTHKTYRLNK